MNRSKNKHVNMFEVWFYFKLAELILFITLLLVKDELVGWIILLALIMVAIGDLFKDELFK